MHACMCVCVCVCVNVSINVCVCACACVCLCAWHCTIIVKPQVGTHEIVGLRIVFNVPTHLLDAVCAPCSVLLLARATLSMTCKTA